MPHVVVTVIGNAPTQEQKSALFSKISNLLVTVLGPARKLTLVSVRTEPAANWSVGGDEAEDTGLVGVEAVIRTVAGSSGGEQSADDRGNDDRAAGGFGDSDPAAFCRHGGNRPRILGL